MSTMPLDRGAEGWSVLTVAADVTDLKHALDAARDKAGGQAALLDLSIRLMAGPLDEEALREALADALGKTVPGSNVSLALRDGDEFQTVPLVHGYGPSLESRRGRYPAEHRERWSSSRPHVNRNVQDTDIYGANVVVELTNTVRSIVVAPCMTYDGTRIGSITVTSNEPGAFPDEQVESLELAARLFANAPRTPETLAEAS
jgi:GAF domain-containing protein